jgi:tRNA dimethylallyltransferase
MTVVAALVGATATGKSAAALDVAQRLGAEIVSIDSMQSTVAWT